MQNSEFRMQNYGVPSARIINSVADTLTHRKMDFIRRGGFHCGFAAPFSLSLAKQKAACVLQSALNYL